MYILDSRSVFASIQHIHNKASLSLRPNTHKSRPELLFVIEFGTLSIMLLVVSDPSKIAANDSDND